MKRSGPQSAGRVGIEKADRTAGIPLSFLQEAIWIREKESGAKNRVHLRTALRIRGEVDLQILEDTFRVLINRHETLRTNVTLEDGRPRQRIQDGSNWKMNVVDLSGLNVADREREAFRQMEREGKTGFDLENESLLRTTLYRLNDDDAMLFLDMHSMIGDRRLLNILPQEIRQIYHAFVKKEWPSLRPLPVQYADFAIRQRGLAPERPVVEDRAYWDERLKDVVPFELPMDAVRSPESGPGRDVLLFEIEEEVVRAIRLLSSKEEASADLILLTAFFVLLHRYSGQEDICIGWIHPNRGETDLSPLIGRFANALPLRMSLSGNQSFREVLRGLKKARMEDCAHSALAFEEIIEGMKGTRSGSGTPRIPVLFSYDTWEVADSEGEPEIAVLDTWTRFPGVDFSLDLVETGGSLRARIEYSAEVLRRESIERMMIHYRTLLQDILRSPEKRLGEFELLPAEDKDQILKGWNRTEKEIPGTDCVHSLFEKQAAETPDRVALFEGEKTFTYREINERANRLAHFLRGKGVSTETLVAVSLEHSFELVVALLGIVKAGGAYVPLDPTYPADRIEMMLDDCKASFLVTKQGVLDKVRAGGLTSILLDRDWEEIKAGPGDNLENSLTQESLFYVIYTSGSTGRPKGVAGIYKGIINRLYWMWETYPFAEDEVCCMKTSVSFVDHVAEIFGPLLKGVPLVIFLHKEARDVEKTVDLLIDRKITRIVLVPSQLRKMLAMRKEKVFQLTGLRYVFCSGEALPVRLAKQFYQEIRNAKLVNIYGSTEVSADVTYYEVKRFHVDDVLKYFTRSVEFPGSLTEAIPKGHANPMVAGRVTTPDVSLDQIARRFTSSRITEIPITLEEYYRKLDMDVLPFVINTAAPTFIGHMTSALPDFVHDLSKLISQLNQNLVKLETGKSLVFLEREALAILHRCFYEFSDSFYESNAQQVNMNLGLVTTGGTTANIMALLTARNKALFDGEKEDSSKSIYALLREKGYEDMTILGSRLMHYSMRKATSVLGLGIDAILYVDSDRNGELDIEDLKRKVETCRRRRILILAIVGIAGATETGQIEPLDAMGNLANAYGIHFHVDAAWGGTTILSDTYKDKLHGIRKADSITFCGHKQLYLPQGISVCLFKDPRQARYGATSATYQAAPNTYDVGRFTLEGSRSAISLCLHAALRLIGKKGYELLVDSGIEQARFFADLVKPTEAFELIGYPALNIVNYRYVPVAFRKKLEEGALTEEDNRRINYVNVKIQETQFYKGKTFVSKTTLFSTKYGPGKEIVVFRVVLSNPLTTEADIYDVLEDQLAIVKDLFGETNEQGLGKAGVPAGVEWEGAFAKGPVFVDEYHEAFVPIGKPLTNCSVYILDKYGNPTPIGVPGEIHVAGAAVNRGYYNMPELTDEVFVPNPFVNDPGARMVRTGDRARFLRDGNIEYLGRNDEQVKIQGHRVEIAEIESALGEMENVEQCAVVARTDGEGNRMLAAYVVFETGSSDPAALHRALSEKLPEYMVPSLFEVIDTMPLTPSGKTDKKALLEIQSAEGLAADRR